MLAHRLRRWPDVKPALGQRLCLLGKLGLQCVFSSPHSKGGTHIGKDVAQWLRALRGTHIGRDVAQWLRALRGTHIGRDVAQWLRALRGTHIGRDVAQWLRALRFQIADVCLADSIAALWGFKINTMLLSSHRWVINSMFVSLGKTLHPPMLHFTHE